MAQGGWWFYRLLHLNLCKPSCKLYDIDTLHVIRSSQEMAATRPRRAKLKPKEEAAYFSSLSKNKDGFDVKYINAFKGELQLCLEHRPILIFFKHFSLRDSPSVPSQVEGCSVAANFKKEISLLNIEGNS